MKQADIPPARQADTPPATAYGSRKRSAGQVPVSADRDHEPVSAEQEPGPVSAGRQHTAHTVVDLAARNQPGPVLADPVSGVLHVLETKPVQAVPQDSQDRAVAHLAVGHIHMVDDAYSQKEK